jgi:hypothetical protein
MPKRGRPRLKILGFPEGYDGPGVYTLTSPSGAVYVGSSVNIRSRLSAHRTRQSPRWDWVAVVLTVGAYDVPQLREMEAKAIRTFAQAGMKVANALHAGRDNHTLAMHEHHALQTKKRIDRVRADPAKPKRPQYTIDGVTAPMGFWLASFGAGVSYELALSRLRRGWGVKEAFSTPPDPKRGRPPKFFKLQKIPKNPDNLK